MGLMLEDEGRRLREQQRQQAELERYKRWVDDLQSGIYVNCVYCGYRYGRDGAVPASMADVLKEHVQQCPEHPMSKLRRAGIAAWYCLRSYEFGNVSPDLAAQTCRMLERVLGIDPEKPPVPEKV
jgi:hypothetical protein